MDAVNAFVGTGGRNLNTYAYSVASLWNSVVDFHNRGYIVTASSTNTDLNGTNGEFFYSFISHHILSNGVKIFKLRNPCG